MVYIHILYMCTSALIYFHKSNYLMTYNSFSVNDELTMFYCIFDVLEVCLPLKIVFFLIQASLGLSTETVSKLE